jgi:glucose dehydrogenase
VCPGIYGSLEYAPPAYSPSTGLIYLPGLNLCTVDRLLPPGHAAGQLLGAAAFGGTATPVRERPSGFLAALDPGTGRIRWQVRVPGPMIGGALATAGNIIFSGADDGRFYAFDAHTGSVLWSAHLGLGFGAAPITYAVDSTQYVAIAAGGSAVIGATGARAGGTFFVFKLGGKALAR